MKKFKYLTKLIPSFKYNEKNETKKYHIKELKKIYIECDEKNKEEILKQIKNFSKELIKVRKDIEKDLEVICEISEEVVLGSIIISLDKKRGIHSQGYEMDIGNTIKISASTEVGIFYGTRTLLHLIYSSTGLHYGKIVDYPQVKERSLMIDIGRKFYSKEWLKNLIEYMSIIKLNTLQLHFSENLGFRISCDKYPDIVSKEHLTKEDIREVIAHAKEFKIEIIPEIDSPGHLDYVLRNYPEFNLEKIVNGEKILVKSALNIVSDKGKEFIKDILCEYMELFKDSKYFHIGADEFIEWEEVHKYPQLLKYSKDKYGSLASGLEAYVDYVNEIAEFVREKGFMPRAWNDGFFRFKRNSLVELTKNIEITYWTRWSENMAYTSNFIEKGYKIVNFNDNYFYYVLGEAACYKYPTAKNIYENWDNRIFAKDQVIDESYDDNLLGSSFAIWSDIPEAQSQGEVAEGIFEPLSAMAEKSWGSNSLDTYEEFEEKMKTLKELINLKSHNFIRNGDKYD